MTESRARETTTPPGRLSRLVVAAAAIACLTGYVFVYTTGRTGPPIRSDGFSYYIYLPSWFLFHDSSLAAIARDCCGGEFPEHTAIIRWPGTRRWVNAHPIGVAVLQSPFFLAADRLTRWTNLSPDGFTLYYQHAAGLSGLVWTLLGLAILRRLLLRHFTDRITAAALATVLFGTNLFHYATFDSSYSHAYSFCLLALFLYLCEGWHRSPRVARSVGVGAVAGLIVLVRHTNALFLVCLPLYGVTGVSTLRERLRELRRDWRLVAIMTATTAAVVAPQMALYYQATGRPVVSAYGALGFDFRHPHLAGVLFSPQKGLFFWSPILVLACAGLAWLWRTGHTARAFITGAVLFLVIDTYLIASWWDWQFGGSFGHRGFTDALPVFAIGLAGFFTWAGQRRITAVLSALAATGLVVLSLFQMLQYLERRPALQRHDVAAIPQRVPEVAMSAQTTRSEACRGRRSDAAVLGLVLVLVLAAVVSLLALLRDPSWLDQVQQRAAGLGDCGGWRPDALGRSSRLVLRALRRACRSPAAAHDLRPARRLASSRFGDTGRRGGGACRPGRSGLAGHRHPSAAARRPARPPDRSAGGSDAGREPRLSARRGHRGAGSMSHPPIPMGTLIFSLKC